jgi:uncharacterized protein YdeI (YjbR/CyaY-like superfamily)
MKREFQQITPVSRADFRRWLAKNNQQRESIWVVIYKNSSATKNLSASDVAEEALCFGWIDSVPGKIDAEKYKLLVSPRKPSSVWSALNKRRVKELIKTRQMTSAGLKAIQIAKKNGAWTKLSSSDQLLIPKELRDGLTKSKSAAAFFYGLAPSSKRPILEWINGAKTKKTKANRIAETIRLAKNRIRANNYLDRDKIKKLGTKDS